MIAIYVWQPGQGNIGHAAASVQGSHAAYVSWWPGGDWSKKEPGVAMTSYADDINQEGRGADWTASITGLNEADGVKWWSAFSSNPASTYSAIGQNCSWAVAMFLKACGGDSRISWSQSGHAYNLPAMLEPGWTQAYRMYLWYSAKGAGAAQLSDYADNHTMTWTPTDIVRYANCVNGKSAEAGLMAASKIAAPAIGGRSAPKKIRKI